MSVARYVVALAAVTAGIVAAGASAGTFTVAPLTVISGASPFSGCAAGAAPGSVL
jgi:hypothetical protein